MKEIPFKMLTHTEKEQWRQDTFWTKEPETLAWIDTFKVGEGFLDIGANIGVYSMYAATRGCIVMAIEPHPQNYTSLCANVGLNAFINVHPIWAAVGATPGIERFGYSNWMAGSSDGGIGFHSNWTMTPIKTVDEICREFAVNHIKIDVDGAEDLVVAGMTRSLLLRSFRSCLIEVEPRVKPWVVDRFLNSGYNLDSALNDHPEHSRNRRLREGIHVENIIFVRNP